MPPILHKHVDKDRQQDEIEEQRPPRNPVRVMNDNITVEEAQKLVSVDEVTKEKMEILSYDDSISIDIPEI